MASATKFSYQRLKNEGLFEDYEEREKLVRSPRPPRSWFKFKRVHMRRRFRLEVPRLRRFLRRKLRLVAAVRVSCAKVAKRLKESQAHFGDLFAGNYLFLQVNPTPLKCYEKCYHAAGINLRGLPSRPPPSRIA